MSLLKATVRYAISLARYNTLKAQHAALCARHGLRPSQISTISAANNIVPFTTINY